MSVNINFILNNELISDHVNPSIVLLDYIRSLKHTGTKEGCKEGDCGACTVLAGELVNNEIVYSSLNSCLIPIQNIRGKHIVTIEGLNLPGKELNPIQQAFVDEGATQCGFCTPGFIVSLTGYFLNYGILKNNNVIDSIDGNICRCTGHNSIIRAARKLSGKFDLLIHSNGTRLKFLSENKIIPEYFLKIKERLSLIADAESNLTVTASEKKYFVSGGTDLFVQRPDEMLHSEVAFLGSENSLKGISLIDNECKIGSLTTVSELLESDIINRIFPDIGNFAELFGSTPIRNSATIGGNLNNASPIGDMTAFFLVMNSDVILSDGKNKRSFPLNKFYKSYKVTEKEPGEFMESITFKIPEGTFFFNFEKVSKRTYLDIASVNTAILIFKNNETISEINISAGGVSAIPLYLKATCEFLKGREINPENILAAVQISLEEISPISDARGSAEYKRMLLTGLLKTHFIKLFPELMFEGDTV